MEGIPGTILEQLGGPRFVLMVGARSIAGCERTLSFRIGRNRPGVTHVTIELNGLDLYDLDFTSVRSRGHGLGMYRRTVARVFGLGAEQLRATFTTVTGLETSL